MIGSADTLTLHNAARRILTYTARGSVEQVVRSPHSADELDRRIAGGFTESVRAFLASARTGPKPIPRRGAACLWRVRRLRSSSRFVMVGQAGFVRPEIVAISPDTILFPHSRLPMDMLPPSDSWARGDLDHTAVPCEGRGRRDAK